MSAAPPPEREESAEASGIDRWLRPYIADSTLWPVLFVAVATVVTFLGAAMALAAAGRNLFAAAALAILFWMSLDGFRVARRRGAARLVGGLLLAVWLGSALVAFTAVRLGAF